MQVNITIGWNKYCLTQGYTLLSLNIHSIFNQCSGLPASHLVAGAQATPSTRPPLPLLCISSPVMLPWCCRDVAVMLWCCDNIGNVVANIIIGVVGMIANIIGNGLTILAINSAFPHLLPTRLSMLWWLVATTASLLLAYRDGGRSTPWLWPIGGFN